MYNNYYSELYHYGIKGQKWGVRRFQNEDGTYTELGRRIRNASRTKKKVDEAFKKLSKHDRYLLDAEENDKEWIPDYLQEYVVKRITKKKNGEVVGVYDIQSNGIGKEYTEVAAAIFVTPEGRGKGYAKEMAIRGKKWFDTHKQALQYTSIGWYARKENVASQKTAQVAGFKYNPKESDDKWEFYEYKR